MAQDSTESESRPLPAIAGAAFAFARAEYQRTVEALARQALDAMGLAMADGWKVYPDQGVVVREVPE